MPDPLAVSPAPAGRLPAGGAPCSSERHLLTFRALVLNLAAAALLAAAWHQDLVAPLFDDPTYQCHLIAVVFLGALGLCLRRIGRIGREHAELDVRRFGPGSRAGSFLGLARRMDGQGRAALAGSLRLHLANAAADVRHAGNLLVLLGLIGTVVGFIMALDGVDPAAAGDAGAIGPMVAGLIEGMGVALNTTLLGSILSVWLGLNARLLETGSQRLLARLIEIAEVESHA